MARILVVNAGSSSLKLSLIGAADETLTEHAVDPGEQEQLKALLADAFAGADFAGHRIVHGGERFRSAVLIDARVKTELRALTELAPLHQPKSLAALDAVSAALPDVPAIGCFDTAFHATLPAAAATYALPRAWRERWGIQRYGFHGLSHAWVARRVPELLGRDRSELRIISCHLGAGASLCAIAAGRSIDTTMGFTPLEGLVMATRSGSVDPGLLLWLLERCDLSERELADALEHRSGLLGLGGSADMRELLARADDAGADDAGARGAIEVYLHRLRSGIGAMAAALGGVDALAFTGGVGENSPPIRAGALDGLGFLGLSVDPERNHDARLDARISPDGAGAAVVAVRAREDLEIARQVRELFA